MEVSDGSMNVFCLFTKVRIDMGDGGFSHVLLFSLPSLVCRQHTGGTDDDKCFDSDSYLKL